MPSRTCGRPVESIGAPSILSSEKWWSVLHRRSLQIFFSGGMIYMDDFLDLWVDFGEVLPWLPSEPYFVQEGHRGVLVGDLGRVGFSVFEVDLMRVRTERDLLVKLGQILSAPGYFGKNWDALRDVLRDRGVRGPFRVAIVFSSSIAFHDANLHQFLRSVSLLQMTARVLSEEDSGQLEIFYPADWGNISRGAIVRS